MLPFARFAAISALLLTPLVPLSAHAQGLDAAAVSVRVDRLENQVRNLTGQIEQQQFQIRRLEEQLRKFQQDVDFRFDEMKPKPAGAKPGAAPAPAPAPAPAAPPPGRRSELETTAPAVATLEPARPGRRGDAFDPSANPEAPGAPRDLVGVAPGANAAPAPRVSNLPTGPLAAEDELPDPNAPLDLMGRGRGASAGLAAPMTDAPLRAPEAVTASIPVDNYELGLAAFRGGQLEQAEQYLRSYLTEHPKDRLSSEAIFYLGESYFRRARPREAAEQYLKLSTDFPRAARAPESLVRLGLALEKLGAKEQACAAFGEVPRKYPSAPVSVRQSAERESKRVQC